MRQAIRPDQSILQSQDPFDDRTGYRTDYIRHPAQDRYQRPREEYVPSGAALDSLTTHRRDYTPKDGEDQIETICKHKLRFSFFS